MPRPDLSDRLIHFIRADSFEAAFAILQNIVETRALFGSTRQIKGGYECVCFTELSFEIARHRFVNAEGFSRYKPFGVMVRKEWLFGLGGRPCIYQPDDEYELLPESHRWRHVRFDPLNGIDFSWEREWRIQTSRLILDDPETAVLAPDGIWGERLYEEHREFRYYQFQQYSLVLGEDLAQMYYQDFPWPIREVDPYW